MSFTDHNGARFDCDCPPDPAGARQHVCTYATRRYAPVPVAVKPSNEDWRAIRCEDVAWSSSEIRLANVLHNVPIDTLGDLADYGEHAFLRLPNCGRHSLNAAVAVIRRAMAGEDVTRRKAPTLGDLARKGARQ